VEAALPEGVLLIEVPVPAETAAHYGDAPPTGRHPLLADWIAGAEPRTETAESARMSLIYTSRTTGLAKGVLRDAMTAEQSLSSLECVVHAAAPCPVHVKRRMIEWFGPVILEHYGATEIGIVVACDSREWLAHEGTVGKPMGSADIHVFDPTGALLASGETGEVYIRPPGYWPGFTYLDQEDQRREIDRDGDITIGDVGRVDEDGFLHLSDRARDMVDSGGANIYPAEIEACLLELEGVRDVAVFGIPDEHFGEALAAHVDADPSAGLTETTIRDHVRERLAGFKVPKVVVFDEELPREESGKIFKRRIRVRYWQDAGRNI
jgi:long-chain acyl-CoA synthetase